MTFGTDTVEQTVPGFQRFSNLARPERIQDRTSKDGTRLCRADTRNLIHVLDIAVDPRQMRIQQDSVEAGARNVTEHAWLRARPRRARPATPGGAAPRPANRPRRASRESVWSIWNAQDGAFDLDF